MRLQLLFLSLSLFLFIPPRAARADDLTTLASHATAARRAAAARRLAKRKGAPQVIDALIKALADPSPRVRGAALGALGQLRAQRALFAACALREDRAAEVRAALKKAARRLGGAAGCAPFQIKLEIEGADAEANALAKQQISAGLAKNMMFKVTDTPPLKAQDRRAKVLKLKVELEKQPQRVRCAVHQSVLHSQRRALSGFAKQQAEIDFDKIYSEDFLKNNINACFNAVSSAVVETFEDYLIKSLDK